MSDSKKKKLTRKYESVESNNNLNIPQLDFSINGYNISSFRFIIHQNT